MTSNVHGIADDSGLDALRLAGAESGAGERAVREAMREAGVDAGRSGARGRPLGRRGHRREASPAIPSSTCVGAVNLGGPVASAPTREGVGVLSIEHEEDLVPATGGVGASVGRPGHGVAQRARARARVRGRAARRTS